MNDEDNHVGYCSPPRLSKFKKGKSGNPRGRPRGASNPGTILAKTLRERVKIQENGRERTITKLQAIMKQSVNRAAKGDPKGTQQLINLFRIFQDQIGTKDDPRLAPTELHVHFLESDGDGRPKHPDIFETDDNGNVIE